MESSSQDKWVIFDAVKKELEYQRLQPVVVERGMNGKESSNKELREVNPNDRVLLGVVVWCMYLFLETDGNMIDGRPASAVGEFFENN